MWPERVAVSCPVVDARLAPASGRRPLPTGLLSWGFAGCAQTPLLWSPGLLRERGRGRGRPWHSQRGTEGRAPQGPAAAVSRRAPSTCCVSSGHLPCLTLGVADLGTRGLGRAVAMPWVLVGKQGAGPGLPTMAPSPALWPCLPCPPVSAGHHPQAQCHRITKVTCYAVSTCLSILM